MTQIMFFRNPVSLAEGRAQPVGGNRLVWFRAKWCARVYYLTRSQPPMLSLMVSEIYNVTSDKAFLTEVFPALMQEYTYWTFPDNSRLVSTRNVTLARYLSTDNTPRPESYAEDIATAAGAGFPDPASAGAVQNLQ